MSKKPLINEPNSIDYFDPLLHCIEEVPCIYFLIHSGKFKFFISYYNTIYDITVVVAKVCNRSLTTQGWINKIGDYGTPVHVISQFCTLRNLNIDEYNILSIKDTVNGYE